VLPKRLIASSKRMSASAAAASSSAAARSERATSTSASGFGPRRVATTARVRPRASTNASRAVWVASCCNTGQLPIARATAVASPRTSTGFPLERVPPAFSTTVTSQPVRASQ
jgi:hypothetical protein